MAFVYEEERKFNFNPGTEKNELGPGQYLAQTEERVIDHGLSSFESKVPRFYKNEDITPAPGQYYIDRGLEKIQKQLDNEKISQITEVKAFAEIKKYIAPNDPETAEIYRAQNQSKTNFERLGFSSKVKRFQEPENRFVPGPGECLNDKSKKECKQILNKCQEMKKKVYKIQPGQLKDSFGHVNAIPQKLSFGYEIDNENKLVKKENPDQFKFFSGEKGDTVGPGTYDVDFPEKWKQTGTNWSKSKVYRSSKEGKKKSLRPKSCNTNILEEGNYREPENNERQCNFMNIDKFKSYAVKQLLSHGGINPPSFSKIEFARQANHKPVPGPGYYYDVNLHSGFHSAALIPKHKSSKNFGSVKDRFSSKSFESSKLGPGSYFSNNHSQTFINKHSKLKSKKTNKAPFNTNSTRFADIPSATSQTMSSSASVASTTTTFETKLPLSGTFYRKQRRFIENEKEMERKMETPGPGSYIDPYSATGNSNTMKYNGRLIELRKGRDYLMYNSRPKTSKEDVLEEKRRRFGPSVGTYDPGRTQSLEYENLKKAEFGKSREVCFWSRKLRAKGPPLKPKNPVGPGSYFKNPKPLPKPNKEAFNSAVGRNLDDKYLIKNDEELHKEFIGPGKYSYDDCYSWIKKSFNVKYI